MVLVDDLGSVGKKVYFWNWKESPYHTMLRYRKENAELFKNNESLKDLIEKLQKTNGKTNGVVIYN